MSNTCMHYSKRALVAIVSLVTQLFNSVLWLGSRAKSPPGKGIQQETFFAPHPLSFNPIFFFCLSWRQNLQSHSAQLIWNFQPRLVSGWARLPSSLLMFPAESCSSSFFTCNLSSLSSWCFFSLPVSSFCLSLPHPITHFIIVLLCVCSCTSTVCLD